MNILLKPGECANTSTLLAISRYNSDAPISEKKIKTMAYQGRKMHQTAGDIPDHYICSSKPAILSKNLPDIPNFTSATSHFDYP
jgi:hypothetical protein